MANEKHETSVEAEGTLVRADGPDPAGQARALHHLATADPEPERDGTMTGPAHEELYGLERAKASAAAWRARGVHPTENRALVEGEEGAENLRGFVPRPDGAAKRTADDVSPRAARSTSK